MLASPSLVPFARQLSRKSNMLATAKLNTKRGRSVTLYKSGRTAERKCIWTSAKGSHDYAALTRRRHAFAIIE